MPLDAPPPSPQVETKPAIDLELVVASDEELEKPYRVIIENDDVTPMDFVVAVLVTIFALDVDQAYQVMFEAHHQGHALVTVLPFQEAQDRVYAAQSIARDSGYPLSFYLEPDS
ncbi:ATP-dependent Clp protease adaptor ClpS [Chloroflexia bacterium SDU3-3]|nr:ATP-dependent Clp protease adaptor ClpS [Chloroflexia bacterium SDU3-3]